MNSRPTPSLELIAEEVRAQRDAHVRHTDAVDSKAGVLLGFSGGFAALISLGADGWRIPALLSAVAAAVAAVSVIDLQRFPDVILGRLRRDYLTSDRVFTQILLVDTGIETVMQMRVQLERKARRLRVTIWLLVCAAALAVIGTLVSIIGG